MATHRNVGSAAKQGVLAMVQQRLGVGDSIARMAVNTLTSFRPALLKCRPPPAQLIQPATRRVGAHMCTRVLKLGRMSNEAASPSVYFLYFLKVEVGVQAVARARRCAALSCCATAACLTARRNPPLAYSRHFQLALTRSRPFKLCWFRFSWHRFLVWAADGGRQRHVGARRCRVR